MATVDIRCAVISVKSERRLGPGFCGIAAMVITMIGVSMTPSTAQHRSVGLTAVPGLRVGHHTMAGRPTGCTVVLVEDGAVGGVDVRGAAPGTRETDLLDPVASVDVVHAIALAGGSAFGLAVATGVQQYLEEQGVGFTFGAVRIPIVPQAILFDLGVGDDPTIRPTAECGYEAARRAHGGPVEEGNVGAGAGATVGKLRGTALGMKSGVGTAAIRLDDGVVVAALAAVNAAGDVIDPATGEVVAGMRTEDGRGLVDVRRLIREGRLRNQSAAGQNTTLGIVATNATLTKAQATKLAQMAHDGFARTIYPVHTPVDGDVIFTLATGEIDTPPDVLTLGALAAEVVAQAVLRAVLTAEGIPGYPSARDLAAR